MIQEEQAEETGRSTNADFRTFIQSRELRALANYLPPFNPLRSLGVEHRELSHSAFLRFMLDPNESHGLGNRFLLRFLKRLDPEAARNAAEIDPESISVRVEVEQIDVLVECGHDGPVIGIEVKVWAGEGWNQLRRYQELIEHRYPGRTSLLVFLTPDGRKPVTVHEDTEFSVRCEIVSWSDVDDMLHNESRHCRDAGVAAFMIQFGRHLRDMVNGDLEERKLIARLFKNPKIGAAVLKAAQVRQSLFSHEVVNALKSRIETQLEEKDVKVEASNWTNTQNKEVQFRVTSDEWGKLPLVFLFYDYPYDAASGAGMHLLLGERLPDSQSSVYIKALRATYPDDQASDELLPLRGWGGTWHLALPSSKYPDGSRQGWRFDDRSFDEEWIDIAAKRFAEGYKLIKPVVDHYRSKNV